MPKLSLKKNNNESSKNQRAITHFFKNSDTKGAQLTRSPTKLKHVFKETEIKPAKRKATSPLKPVFTHEPIENSIITKKEQSPIKLTAKKHKFEIVTSIDIQKNNIATKENVNLSKYESNNEVLPSESILEDHEKCDTNTINKKNTGSPMSYVDTNSKSPLKNNHNLLDHEKVLKVETLTKVLDFDKLAFNSINKDVTLTPKKYCKVSAIHHEGKVESGTYKSTENSPSKNGSTVKSIELCEDDLFGCDWDVDNILEENSDNLDLTTIQRCEVTSVKPSGNSIELGLSSNNLRTTCLVEGSWLCLNILEGDIISVLASRNSLGQFYVNSITGLIVYRPDYLLSSTSVVAGVFCQRKAVLQERWRGIDSANIAMTIGILIHELVQKTLTERIFNVEKLRIETDKIIKESTQMLFDAGLSEEEARSNMEMYIIPLSDFMNTYVAKKPIKDMQKSQKNWSGHIEKVLDIEENLCCPKLGLKGKIDATLEVTIHERQGKKREIVPLEIKSGRASGSVEHRGQLVLYGMMLSLLREEDPTTSMQRGLLLYLKERVELREVSCGYPERRDLVMLRNQLVQYLATGGGRIDDDLDVEDKHQKLPEPIHREAICAKCPYLTICSLHLWHTDGPKVSTSHPLSKLRDDALGHLSLQHIEYFLHWTHLMKLEEKVQLVTSPLHALWTDSVEKRVKRGTCAGNLKLDSVQSSGNRYLHCFRRNLKFSDEIRTKGGRTNGPQEGDFSIVGIENRPWLAAGVVLLSNDTEIKILLERLTTHSRLSGCCVCPWATGSLAIRDLSLRQKSDTTFHIDAYESYATTVQNLTNLGVLIEDSERAQRLRSLIIDKTKPSFADKLPREMHRIGAKTMRSLNIEQQRAVFKALSAKDYALLQGLPGTGKTQTVSVLIQMLVALKQRVLVTAHTHSAVDTVLCRLPESIKIMRLGSTSRVAPKLLCRCEEKLTSSCENPEQLSQLFDSMEVVGVTCLGAAHAMLTRTTFDVCVVDEATQVLQCTVLRPLFAAKRFILVGDPEQLPPVVRRNAARQLGMEESLFHRLMTKEATSTLQLQYRMNQPLADLANRIAYSDRLKCANPNVANACLNISVEKILHLFPSESSWLAIACSAEPKYAAIFINLKSIPSENDGNTRKTVSNWEETLLVLGLVEAMKEGGVKSSDIGVIAPYRDQVSLLRRTLSQLHVEASTVDQFQGRDKSAIIYSCTKKDDGQKNKTVKEEEILNDQRRLAVSVTRSKHKLIVIGNSNALRRYEPIQRLINSCHEISIDIDVMNRLSNKYKYLQAN